MTNKIEIPLSRWKIGLLFAGSVLFVVLGLLFAVQPENWSSRSPVYVGWVGVVAVLFFGICAVSIGKRFFSKKVGLLIDERGITDYTNGTSIGLVEWEDITGIYRIEIALSKILMIKTDKPEKYIAKAKNVFARQAMKANHKMYGSPISIISNSLAMDFDELEKLVRTEWEKRTENS